jgi:MFS family permease
MAGHAFAGVGQNDMHGATHLLKERRFLPLFVTQALGAFNDNLFKTAMVLFVVYNILADPRKEETFSGVATAISILPFFLLSAVAGQLSDANDKAKVIRWVKTAEVGIMAVGATGLLIASLPGFQTFSIVLMLLALFALGVHSAFFGPTKYAILPQHLKSDEVLAGTGLVEAGTYVAILLGTITAGFLSAQQAAIGVIIVAVIGWIAGRQVPPAPPIGVPDKVDWNIFRASWTLIAATTKIRVVILAIIAISFFWGIGVVMFIQFPPLVKNVLNAEKDVASLFLAIFSIGIAIGSVAINRLLKGEVSARYSPISVIVMGAFVIAFYLLARDWPAKSGPMLEIWSFVQQPGAALLCFTLLGVATAGGMFVVPLYAFLTTRVALSETARTVAANNIVNAGCMVGGSLVALSLTQLGVPSVDQFLLAAAMCVVSAWLAILLRRAEKIT